MGLKIKLPGRGVLKPLKREQYAQQRWPNLEFAADCKILRFVSKRKVSKRGRYPRGA